MPPHFSVILCTIRTLAIMKKYPHNPKHVTGIGHGPAWGASNLYHPNTRSFHPPGCGPSNHANNPISSTRQTTTFTRPAISENSTISDSRPTGSHTYNLPKIVIHPSSPPLNGRSQSQLLQPLQTRTAKKSTYTSNGMLSPQHACRKNAGVQTFKPGQISYNPGSSVTGSGMSR